MSSVYVSGMEHNPISFLARCSHQIDDVSVATYVTDVILGSVETPTISEAIAAIESLGHQVDDVLHATCGYGQDDLDHDRRYQVTFCAVPTDRSATATVELWGSEVVAFVDDMASSGWWELLSVSTLYGSR